MRVNIYGRHIGGLLLRINYMKFKILIDKNTFKENPASGSTELLESGAETTVFEIKGFAALKDNYTCILEAIQKYTDKSFIDYDRTFHILTMPLGSGEAYIVQDWIDRNKNIIEIICIETKRNLIRHKTIPQQQYLFDYEPTIVECESCRARFNNTYLKSDYDDGAECNIYNVCPVCDESFCCELEFETIEEYFDRVKYEVT
jgi:hypothetical protein